MGQLETVLYSPITYAVLEGIVILILLFFVVRWTKERKQWNKEQELQKKMEQENAFLQKLANEKRRAR